ncbi:MAG: DnaA regulatory inactivator Hda [Halioglobus sp.]
MSSTDTVPNQLPLNVRLRDDATLDNFLCNNGHETAIAAIKGQLAETGEPVVYLYGAADTGKSHLLQAACHEAGNGALYLPLDELAEYSPADVLQGMEHLKLVCLDDIDAVLGQEQWEHALFHFYNRAREEGCRILVAGAAAPRVLDVKLPDLQSRLSWSVVFQLGLYDDEIRQEILVFRAARRGLSMPPEVANYIITRAPRGLSALLNLLEQLDNASLIEQRSLSIPFVKSQFAW